MKGSGTQSNQGKTKKYPVVYIYRKSDKRGDELRHSLRSLKNLKEFNGQVFIVGDSHDWFSDEITHIPLKVSSYSPYKDAESKWITACRDERIADDFIMMNDDYYITTPTKLPVMHRGEIQEPLNRSMHTYALYKTKLYLQEEHGIDTPLNYAIHAPMLINKAKRLHVSTLIRDSLNVGHPLLARTVYGNLYNLGGELTTDLKTYTGVLKEGTFISTSFYTEELATLFPDKSIYELSDFFVYDDTEQDWQTRHRRINRNNGAKTYTREILKYQIPLWKKHVETASISTTNVITRIKDFTPSDINVQYLHTYPFTDPLLQVKTIVSKIPNTIFVVSYRALHDAIHQAGYKSIFIPMTIDGDTIPNVDKTKPNDHIIYYGNITKEKTETYTKLKSFFEDKGWTFDTISENQFNNGKKLSQQQCLEIVGHYHYAIAVGRCYMEASAMGVKTIIAGNGIGGYVSSKTDHQKQVDTNYNARYFTKSDDLETIYKNISKIKPYYEDIKENLDLIENTIKEAII